MKLVESRASVWPGVNRTKAIPHCFHIRDTLSRLSLNLNSRILDCQPKTPRQSPALLSRSAPESSRVYTPLGFPLTNYKVSPGPGTHPSNARCNDKSRRHTQPTLMERRVPKLHKRCLWNLQLQYVNSEQYTVTPTSPSTTTMIVSAALAFELVDSHPDFRHGN